MSQNLIDMLYEGTRWIRITPVISGFTHRGDVVQIGSTSDMNRIPCTVVKDGDVLGHTYYYSNEYFLQRFLPLCHWDVKIPDSFQIRKDIEEKMENFPYSCYWSQLTTIGLYCNSSTSFTQRQEENNRPRAYLHYTDILGKDYQVSQFETPKSPTPASDEAIKSGVVVSDTVSDGRIDDELDKAKENICYLNSELNKSIKNARELDRKWRASVEENGQLCLKYQKIKTELSTEINRRIRLGYDLVECEDSLKSASQECSNLEYLLENQDNLLKENHRLKQELIDADQHSHDQHHLLKGAKRMAGDLAAQNNKLQTEVNILREQLNRPKETIIRKLFK